MAEAEELRGVVEIEIDSCYTGRSYKVTVDLKDDVLSIKKILDDNFDIPSSNSILLFKGQELDNYAIIKEVGIKGGSKLQLVLHMTVGPINIKKVYSEGIQKLKNAVEKTRKELCKKYPDGARVLAIMHKNSSGQYEVIRIFDGIQEGKNFSENGTSLRPKSPTIPPKPSSPCELIKYRISYSDDDSCNTDPSTLSRKKVTEKDHWVVIKKLAEERRLKFKLNLLISKMNGVASNRKYRKGLRDLKVLKPSSPWQSQCTTTEEAPFFYNKVLHFKEEFTYPAFMACLYDKNELTPEMRGYKHITFRVVSEKYPKSSDDSPMVFYDEEQALKEKSRNQYYYMIIRNQEDLYDEVMILHEIRLRLEADYLEMALMRRGFLIEHILDFILEFLWSGDVSYRYFMSRSGLHEVAEIAGGGVNADRMEEEDFKIIPSCYKETIFEAYNPLYDESAASSSTLTPPFSGYTADCSDETTIENGQQYIKDHRVKSTHTNTNISPSSSKKSKRANIRSSSHPYKSPRGRKSALSKNTYSGASDLTGEMSAVDYADSSNLMRPLFSDNINTSLEVQPGYEKSDIESVSDSTLRSFETSTENTYRRASDIFASPTKGMKRTESVDSLDYICGFVTNAKKPSKTLPMVENMQQGESYTESASDDNTLGTCNNSTGNTYPKASDILASSTREMRRTDSVDSLDYICGFVTNAKKPLKFDTEDPADDNIVDPFRRSLRNNYRRASDPYSFPTHDVTSVDSTDLDLMYPHFSEDNIVVSSMKKYIRNIYRRASDPFVAPSREITDVDCGDSTDSSWTVYSPKSSTPGDSSFESDSDENRLVIDLEGGDEGKAEVTTDLDDQPLNESTDIETISVLSLPMVERTTDVYDTPMEKELVNVMTGDDILENFFPPINMVSDINDLLCENNLDEEEVHENSMHSMEKKTERAESTIEKVVSKDDVKKNVLPPVEKIKRIKCSVCKKRLKLTDLWNCRCGNIFCSQHRYAESHQCTFDYRNQGQQTIAEQNPRVIAEKIKKI